MTSSGQNLVLRAYEPADAAATLAVFTEAITQTAAADYAPEQVEAWARPGRRDLAEWHAAMVRREAVVAVLGAEVVGFSDVDGAGYIDMLFVSPRHVRRGVASALLRFVEAKARAGGVKELTAVASVTARGFFEAWGFEVVAEQRVVREGVELTNFRMRKGLRRGRVRPVDRSDQRCVWSTP